MDFGLLLLTLVTAQEGAASQENPVMMLLPMVLIGLIFYFLLIRPMRKRQKQTEQMITELKNTYPKVQFVHVTSPVCSRPKNARSFFRECVKYLVGRPTIWDDNVKRQGYNGLLTSTFEAEDPVFDLARVESVGPDGYRSYIPYQGENVYVLSPLWAASAGNTNEAGSKHIAEQLLIVLAKTATSSAEAVTSP